ncbi:MAG: hypothetical protein JW778_07980 [Candidatus Altiarchaeota archaeon]|nr:hypothetical protein [Candidatus Altiarchaeota archaeon]
MARWMGIGFFFIGAYSFLVAGLIYLRGISVEWYMNPGILIFILLPIPRMALRRFERTQQSSMDIIH